MSSRVTSFVEACLAGEALAEDIDDWVERWHKTNGEPNGLPVPLDDYLGFDEEEGALWAEQPWSLRFAVAAHRYNRPVKEILTGKDEFAVRARADAPEEAAMVLEWLRQTGRLVD